MQRRTLLGATAAAALPAPAYTQPAAARTLRVIPQANLTSLDPVWTTAVVTRNHGYMVWDHITATDEARGIAWRASAAGARATPSARSSWPRPMRSPHSMIAASSFA
ncbi:MAG: hypothetical protein NTW56_18830 [Alphaproteobacteria bacterium]|nr:hypothetical protein [Alphaproteobacteria bacterium]